MARPIYEWALDNGAESVKGAPPDELSILADPACALNGADLGAESAAVLLRPVRLAEKPMVLLSAYEHTESGVKARAFAFGADDVANEGAQFFFMIPSMFGPAPVATEDFGEDIAAADRALTALLRPDPSKPRPGLGAAGAPEFWRRVGSVAMRLPPALAPLMSAAYFPDGIADTLFRSIDESPTYSMIDGAALSMLSTVDSGVAAPDAIAARWPHDPNDAPGIFLSCLRAIAADAAASTSPDLEMFLQDMDAPPPEPQPDQAERAVQLARAAAAAEDAACGRPDTAALDTVDLAAPLPDFGCARAAGFLTIQAGDESEVAWSALATMSPSRAYWSALALSDPGGQTSGLGRFRDLVKIFTLDERLRRALPEGAPTPLDAPRFRRLARGYLMQSGVEGLSYDPEALFDEPGHAPAPGLPALAQLWSEANERQLNSLKTVHDAIEIAAKEIGETTHWERPLRILRSSALKELFRSGVPEQEAPKLEWLALDFTRRLGGAVKSGAWRGAIFWRRALKALLKRAENDGLEVLALVEQAIRDVSGTQSAIGSPALRLLESEVEYAPYKRAKRPAVEPRPLRTAPPAPEIDHGAASPPEPSTPTTADTDGAAAPVETAEPNDGAAAPLSEKAAERKAPSGTLSAAGGEALEIARKAVDRWRARYRTLLRQRKDGYKAEEISFSAPGEHSADAEALEALALCTVEALSSSNPELLTGAIGEDLAWIARQFMDLRVDWKARTGHEPAPPAVRKVWSLIAYSEPEKDLEEESQFFIFFTGKLLQRVDRDKHDPDPLTECFFKGLADASNPSAVGSGKLRSTVAFHKNFIRDYIYLSKRSETAAQADALDDAAVRNRLDRAFLFWSLFTFEELEHNRPGGARGFWDPLFRPPTGEGKVLDVPDAVFDRTRKFLRSTDAQNAMYARTLMKLVHRHHLHKQLDISSLYRSAEKVLRDDKGD